jgi:ferredoxin
VRIELDGTMCAGHARCNSEAPEIFGLDDAGYCQLLHTVVPAGQEQQARDGVSVCPEGALTVLEDD